MTNSTKEKALLLLEKHQAKVIASLLWVQSVLHSQLPIPMEYPLTHGCSGLRSGFQEIQINFRYSVSQAEVRKQSYRSNLFSPVNATEYSPVQSQCPLDFWGHFSPVCVELL